MRLASARIQANTDAEEILQSAGLVNVRSAKANDGKIRYSYGRMEELDFGGRDTTVIYSIELSISGTADNDIAYHKVETSIDILTYLEPNDDEINTLIQGIETAAYEKGYVMEQEYGETYNTTRQSTMMSFLLTKLI